MLDGSRGTDDELHLWVRQWAPDKEHISDLSEKQAGLIIARLEDYARALRQNRSPDIMSEEQKRKAFRLMYRLAELSPSSATVRDRMAGVVEQLLHIKVQPRADVFAGLSARDGNDIIELLKRYIQSEERKKKRRERDANVEPGEAPPP